METNKMTMDTFLGSLKQNVVTKNLIPMELGMGWPILSIRNNNICVTVPFFKSIVKPEDNTLIYPLVYTITATYPKGRVVEYSNLRFNPIFKSIDFSKPVGKFRHESIKDMNKAEYLAKRKELFSLYDKLIECIQLKETFEGDDEERFKESLQILMEPSLEPFYRALGNKFFEKFL